MGLDGGGSFAQARDMDPEDRAARAARFTLLTAGLAGAHLLLWLLLRRVIGDVGVAVMAVLAAGQLISGVLAVVAGVQLRRGDAAGMYRGPMRAAILVGVLSTIAAVAVWFGGAVSVSLRGLDELDIPRLSHH